MNSIKEALLCSLLILAVTGKNVAAANIKAGYHAGVSGMEPIDEKSCMNEELHADPYLSNPLECARTCQVGEARTCYYKFVIERYPTNGVACDYCSPNMTNSICANCQCVPGDGLERMALTVNRMLPGPSIQVCQGDYVVVDVLNNINSEALTIHWHGVKQKGSPHQDGVPNLTQCPIVYKNSFRYQFYADNSGTHFWHAHTGAQKMDGVFGSFIVREPEQLEVHSKLYDFDLANHVMLVNDWFSEETTSRFPGKKIGIKQHLPESFLVNGRGRYRNSDGSMAQLPLEVISVDANNRYRFRFINSICTVCGLQLTIENHKLTVIASDGQPVEPVEVDSIVSFAGERYDFVLNANQPKGAYWIQLRGIGECDEIKLQESAILSYVGGSAVPATKEPTYSSPLYEGRVLNSMDLDCKRHVCVNDLKQATAIDSDILQKEPDVKLIVPIGVVNYSPAEFFKPNEYKNFLGSVNLVLKSKTTLKNKWISVRAGDVHHPFHLHGYTFHVMGMDQPLGPYTDNTRAMTVKYYEQLESENKVVRNFQSPPSKDTYAIPNNGYAVLRFKADNPGFWMFHCHQMFHILVGMELVIQVGEPQDFPETPRDFPKCGNYMPNVAVRNQKNKRTKYI
nr:PREDICTED: laccase-5-like [Megachile rotundata]